MVGLGGNSSSNNNSNVTKTIPLATVTDGRISQGYSIRKRSGRPAATSFQPLFDGQEPQECLAIRQHLYEQCWSFVQQLFMKVKRDAEETAVRTVVDYVHRTYSGDNQQVVAETVFSKRLPVGIICTGVNHYDYDGAFAEIVNALCPDRVDGDGSAINHVAIVKESDASSLKLLLRSIIRQFVEGNGEDFEYDDNSSQSSADELDDDTNDKSKRKRYKSSTAKVDLAKQLGLKWFDLQLLEEWYRLRRRDVDKMVILIPNLMSIETAVISSLIQMLHTIIPQLPVVLLLGVAVLRESAVNDLLPDSCLNCVRIEYFQLSDSTVTMGNLINEMFIKCDQQSKLPIKISSNLLEFLHYSFENCNYSLSDFIRNIHYACLYHFYANPLTILLASGQQRAIERSLCHCHMELLRSLPSFRLWIERMVEDKKDTDNLQTARSMLEDDLFLMGRLEMLLESMRAYQQRFHAAFECLLFLTQRFKKSPYKRSRVQLYLQCMEPAFLQTDYFLQVMRLSRFLSDGAMQDLFKFTREYPSFTQLFTGNFADRWRQLSDRLDGILNDDDGEGGKKQEERLGFYRRDFQTFLIEYFGHNLQHYSSQPLHELFYCTATSRLKKAFQPQPRASIHSALAYPSYYLACDCCSTSNGEDSCSWRSEDICVAYQIYLESGQQINLHDWFIGFSEILKPPSTKQKSTDEKSDEKSDEKMILARFIRCISDLEFMGYIRDSNRKADHVLRLTWGMK